MTRPRPSLDYYTLAEHLSESRKDWFIALPFGAPYPSVLIEQLAAATVPIELDLIDGELRLAVEKRMRVSRPGSGSGRRAPARHDGARRRERQDVLVLATVAAKSDEASAWVTAGEICAELLLDESGDGCVRMVRMSELWICQKVVPSHQDRAKGFFTVTPP